MRPQVGRRIGLAGVAASGVVHRRAHMLMWTATAGAALLFAVLLALWMVKGRRPGDRGGSALPGLHRKLCVGLDHAE